MEKKHLQKANGIQGEIRRVETFISFIKGNGLKFTTYNAEEIPLLDNQKKMVSSLAMALLKGRLEKLQREFKEL